MALYNYLGSAHYWSPLLKKGEIESRTYEEWTSNIDWEKALSGPRGGNQSRNMKKANPPSGRPLLPIGGTLEKWSPSLRK
jgi:hypothetical protein